MKIKTIGLLSVLGILGLFKTKAQILWQDDFSSPEFKKNYDMTAPENFRHLPNGGENGGACIEIKINKGSHHGGSMRYLLKENLGYEPEELYAEYRVRYDESMGNKSAGYGGKAPGFSGTYDEAGWGNRPGYGVEGWSARGTINCDNQNYVQNRYYVYHTYTNYDAPVRNGSTDYRRYNPVAYDINNPGRQPHARRETFASGLDWGDWRKKDDSDMDFNKWYHVKQYVKMNDVGQNNGILRAWVDGKLVCNYTDINFRRVEKLKIYAYWFNYYNGGQDVADGDAYVRIDDFKLYLNEAEEVAVSGVNFSTENSSLVVGKTLKPEIKILPLNASNKSVRWSSSDTEVAMVDESGVITGLNPGLTEITVTTVDGGYTDTIALEVKSSGNSDGSVTIKAPLIDDAYLQGTKSYDNELIRVEENNRTGFLKFNVSSIDGVIKSAKLRLTCDKDSGDGEVAIYKGTSTSWSESNLSVRNAPTVIKKLGALDTQYKEGNTYTWDLDLSSLQSEQQLNFILKHTSGNDVAFATKENNVAISPQLEITYQPQASANTSKNSLSYLNTSVYPNPFSEKINIDIRDKGTKNIILYDSRGRIVISRKINSKNEEDNFTISTKNLNKGMYILEIRNEKHSEIKKIIKN